MNAERLKLLKIADYKYWEVNLHEDQAYLGRLVVWCKRDGDIDFTEMKKDEKEELFEILKKLKSALDKSFRPNRMNYASLANVMNHLHIHVVPRYKSKRKFNGTDFIDERWGQNYSPHKKNKVPDKLLVKIREEIKRNL